jgi:signal transduction histidine kinase
MSARSLGLLAGGLAAYFAILTVRHSLSAPDDAGPAMTAIAGTTAVLMFGVFVASRSPALADKAHAVTLSVGALALANFLADLALTADIKQTTNIASAIVAAGLLLYSPSYVAVYFSIAVAGWLAVTSGLDAPDKWHFFFVLLASGALGGLALWVRMRAIADIEAMRLSNREAYARIEAERQLHEAHNRMRYTEKLESLGVFAGGVAHDLNNVLVSLIGNADLAKRALAPNEPALRHIQLVLDASRRAADLARHMLDYSGKGRLTGSPVHFPQVVRNLKPLLRTAMPSGVELSTVVADSAPIIDGDAGQLEQLVAELVANGAEAAQKGGSTVVVRVDAFEADAATLASFTIVSDCAPGRYVRLAVHDDGKGVAPADLTRVFDPFFTTKGPGRGLGLATVAGIVRSHGGAIRFQSEAGQGSQVTVLLPAASTTEAAPKPAPPVEEALFGGGLVLLADDDAAIRALMREILESSGFEVIEAGDGLEALNRMRTMAGDLRLVILDATMPHLTGPQVLSKTRDLDLDVILTSGYGSKMREEVAEKPVRFLRKPFNPSELMEAVWAVLAAQGGRKRGERPDQT